MYCFGQLNRNEKVLAKQKGVFKNFISLDRIPLEKALPVLSGADILWLSTHPKRKNIIPAKLWDYLAAKQPVLSIAPNPEIREILNGTGAGVQINIKNKDQIIDRLVSSVEAKIQKQPIPIPTEFDHERIKQYDAPAVTKKMAAVFDSIS